MADPLSLAVLSASITGLLMRGAAVAGDPSWSSAASLPGDALNAWRSLRRLQQGRGGQENPLEAPIKSRLQKQVDAAGERYERTGVAQSALAGAVTEMEVALKELSGNRTASRTVVSSSLRSLSATSISVLQISRRSVARSLETNLPLPRGFASVAAPGSAQASSSEKGRMSSSMPSSLAPSLVRC